jgi:hypothetical protein
MPNTDWIPTREQDLVDLMAKRRAPITRRAVTGTGGRVTGTGVAIGGENG